MCTSLAIRRSSRTTGTSLLQIGILRRSQKSRLTSHSTRMTTRAERIRSRNGAISMGITSMMRSKKERTRSRSGAKSTKWKLLTQRRASTTRNIINAIIMERSTTGMKDVAITVEDTAASTTAAMESILMINGKRITADIKNGLTMTTTNLEKYSWELSLSVLFWPAAAAVWCAASNVTISQLFSTLVSIVQSPEIFSRCQSPSSISHASGMIWVIPTSAHIRHQLSHSVLRSLELSLSSISLLRASSSSLRSSWARSSGVCHLSSCTEPLFYHQRLILIIIKSTSWSLPSSSSPYSCSLHGHLSPPNQQMKMTSLSSSNLE